jgi:diadenosine tetraphosphate (Ap4A) HIT family hydrolase
MQLSDNVYETKNFYVSAGGICFVSRQDGGHLRIKMHHPVRNRTELSPQQAIEYLRLSIVVGTALKNAMNKRGVPVVNINYQDMGNWAWKKDPVEPKLHMHIFGRAENATKQIFPEAVALPDVSSGFYQDNTPLNLEDIVEIRSQIELELQKPKYQDAQWHL